MYVPETLVLNGFVLSTVPNFSSRGCSKCNIYDLK